MLERVGLATNDESVVVGDSGTSETDNDPKRYETSE
jgi:hypothetical protein